MKIEPDSMIWTYPGGAKSDLLYENRLETFLNAYEERLVDEYIECRLHINCEHAVGSNLAWWIGSLERIEMEVAYFKQCGILFDKICDAIDHIPFYKDMSKISQANYRRIVGEPY